MSDSETGSIMILEISDIVTTLMWEISFTFFPSFSHSKLSLLPPDVEQEVETLWPTFIPLGKIKGCIFQSPK